MVVRLLFYNNFNYIMTNYLVNAHLLSLDTNHEQIPSFLFGTTGERSTNWLQRIQVSRLSKFLYPKFDYFKEVYFLFNLDDNLWNPNWKKSNKNTKCNFSENRETIISDIIVMPINSQQNFLVSVKMMTINSGEWVSFR